jgi:outer membrane protein assembly factor BamD
MRRLAAVALIALLAGCSTPGTRPDADPVLQLALAREQFAGKDYDDAAATLQELLTSRPPAQIRLEAQFLAGETAMAREEFAEARTYFSEFRDLFPGNPRVPEADFQIADSFARERNRKDRDVTPLREARERFIAFLAAYPGHPRAEAAAQGLASCTAALASYERSVAELYLDRGAWTGAAGRLEGILRDFPGTTDEDRTLYDLVTALTRAGETERAGAYRTRLLTNYPDSPWARKAAGETP